MAAKQIQCFWRQKMAQRALERRKAAKRLAKRRAAALRIQVRSCWNMLQVRPYQNTGRSHTWCSQTIWRGKVARKWLHKQRKRAKKAARSLYPEVFENWFDSTDRYQHDHEVRPRAPARLLVSVRQCML